MSATIDLPGSTAISGVENLPRVIDWEGDALDPAGEAALMRRLAAGDADAMRELLTRFGPKLMRLIGRVTAWAPDCEDLLQEALLTAWGRAHSFRAEGSLEGWLRKLVINKCHNYRRSQLAFNRLLTRFAGHQEQASRLFESPREQDQELEQALRKVRQSDRTVLALFYLEELSAQEVADLMGVTVESIHMRLHRARIRLKEVLEKKPINVLRR